MKDEMTLLEKQPELYEYMHPAGARLLITKPRGAGIPHLRTVDQRIYQPRSAESLAREYGLIGKVLAIGPEVTKFKVGDTILIAQYGGIPIYVSSTEAGAWLVAEGDILALVDDAVWPLIEAWDEGDPIPNVPGTVGVED